MPFILAITSDGYKCAGKCGFEGYSYAWCPTDSSWGYCTPESFLDFLRTLHPPERHNTLSTSTMYPFVIDTTEKAHATTTATKRGTGRNIKTPPKTLPLKYFADYLREEKEVNQEINQAIFLNVDKYPKNYRKAQGFTAFGESCYDTCEKRGYRYTWCHKFESSSNVNSIQSCIQMSCL